MKRIVTYFLIVTLLISVNFLTSCKKVREIQEAGKAKRAAEIHEVIRDIHKAIMLYRKSTGIEPLSLLELTDAGYYKLHFKVEDRWDFTFLVVDTVMEISALSKETFKDGKDHKIKYILKNDEFTGYGTPDGEDYTIH